MGANLRWVLWHANDSNLGYGGLKPMRVSRSSSEFSVVKKEDVVFWARQSQNGRMPIA
jgi:hypothetical protein